MDILRVAVVIEDDKDIRGALRSILTASGFTVHECSNGIEGVDAVARYQPHIVTLDLGLPDIDGFEVARRIRLFSDTYIIMLTALTEELDTLQGLEAGADDFLTKPFRPRELRARVAALLRRPRGLETSLPAPAERVLVEAAVQTSAVHTSAPSVPPSPQTPPAPQALHAPQIHAPQAHAPIYGAARAVHDSVAARVLAHNGLRLDPATRIAEIAGVEVVLTRTEFDLLQALMEGGRVVSSKAELARRLHWEEYRAGAYVSEADEKVVEVHVANLRRKLGDNPKFPRWLETVRGVGYRMTPGTSASN